MFRSFQYQFKEVIWQILQRDYAKRKERHENEVRKRQETSLERAEADGEVRTAAPVVQTEEQKQMVLVISSR